MTIGGAARPAHQAEPPFDCSQRCEFVAVDQRIREQDAGIVAALHDALEFARSGDTLIVWKLDRLARSIKQLIETSSPRR